MKSIYILITKACFAVNIDFRGGIARMSRFRLGFWQIVRPKQLAQKKHLVKATGAILGGV